MSSRSTVVTSAMLVLACAAAVAAPDERAEQPHAPRLKVESIKMVSDTCAR